MKTRAFFSNGQIAVITTLVMATLLGAVALGADVAVLYYNWVQLQKGADAAVLAGANYLTGDSTTDTNQVIQITDQFAQNNGIQPGEIVSTTVSSDYQSVTIVVSRTVPYFFARLLGLTKGSVAARATAEIRATAMPRGVIPIGIQCTQANAQAAAGNCNGQYKPYKDGGGIYQLNQPNPNGDITSGNWEPLAIGANGGNNYRQLIAGGYQGDLGVGDMLGTFTEPGHLVGPTRLGFQDRMQAAGATSFAPTPPADVTTANWQVILVPMVDFTGSQGKSYVPITGFAEMWVTGVSQGGTVSAYFLGLMNNNGSPSGQPCQPGNAYPIGATNSCTPKLVD